MKNFTLIILATWLTFNIGTAQYSETFDVPNKGIIAGPCASSNPSSCLTSDFAGVNWTVEGTLAGFSPGGFFRTAGGVMEGNDVDEEICWLSPVLTITGTASFSLDLSWTAFDDYGDGTGGSRDYIDVSYRINGGAWVFLPNQVGGGPRTVSYINLPEINGGNLDGSLTGVGATGLTGSTLQIRVCGDVNSNQEFFRIDNVAALNANDGSTPLVCDLVLNGIVAVDEDCTDAEDGTITINATTTNGPINYSITGPVNASNSTGVFTGLPPGMYSIALQDGSFAPGACTTSGMATIAVADDMTPPTGTPPADVTVDCPVDIPAQNASLVTNIDDNCFIPCYLEPWINEFHYDNIGDDVNEFIEVAGPAGLDLSIYAIYVYDGFNGTVYNTFPLTGTIPNQQNGYGTASVLTPFLQNQTEGIALVKNGTQVVEFLSYEGVLTATDGPALGMTSIDVGVQESNTTTPTNGSLGRVGAGNRPTGFNFAVLTQTQGALNSGQTITSCPENVPTVAFLNDVNNGGSGSSGDPFIVTRTYRVTDAEGNFADLVQTLTANGCCEAPDVDVTVVASPVCPGEDAGFNLVGTPSAEVTYNINDGVDQTLFLNAAGVASLIIVAPITSQTFNLISVLDTAENCLALLSGSFTVLVQDTEPPMAICQDVTIQLDNDGEASTTASAINNNSTDNCEIMSLGLSQSDFTCSDAGNNTVTLTVTDESSNADTCTATVTVEDDIPPVAVCQDITVFLDGAGSASITAIDLDGGSTDNCSITNRNASITSFTCADVGPNNVTLTITDVGLNNSMCLSVVTVADTVSPIAICQDITVQLDMMGEATLIASAIDNNSSDNCGVLSLGVSTDTFGCSDIGSNPVILTVTDVNNNVSTCSANVTVADNVPPTAFCQNATIELDSMGQASITSDIIDNGSIDNCSIMSLEVSPNTFDCVDGGPNIVVLTVTDVSTNAGSCTATVTIVDNILPSAICQDATVELDASGEASVSILDINDGTFDNCGLSSMVVTPNIFDCTNVGENTVTLIATDEFMNTGNCTATVTVEDNLPPTAICQNIALPLDAMGQATLTPAAINNNSSDNCGILSLEVSTETFDCTNVGFNLVYLIVTDVNNNVSSCSANVTVEDNLPPAAMCQNTTVELDASGLVSITAADINAGSMDNCGIMSLELSTSSFTCSDVGTNTVILTVTDVNSMVSSCSATVTVQDNILPTAICEDITVELGEGGLVTIIPADIDNGSFDNCGIESSQIGPFGFTCEDVGDNTVTLIVTDVNANTNFCTATVTVEDIIMPTALCQDITVELDETGSFSITASDIDNGSDDNCEISSLEVSIEDFSCEDVGTNQVVLTVTDVNANANTCSATVTVEDNVFPTITCINSIISFNGEDQLDMEEANMVTSTDDNCGVESVTYDPAIVTLDQIGDTISVTVTVTDINGNASQCTADVFVSGLPDGWTQDPDGVNCTDGNFVEYDFDEEEFSVSSTNCFYSSPFTSDQTALVQRTLCGNGSITVEVTGITGGLGWAGVVMRESNAPGSKKIQLSTNKNSNFSRREVRTVTNGPAVPKQFPSVNRHWLRLVRQGNFFIGYHSPNGNNWNQVMVANISMGSCVEMGMFVTNYNSNSTIVATFGNVSYTEPQFTPPLSGDFPVASVKYSYEVYPNPATEGIFLDLKEYTGKPVHIEIHNMNGQLVNYTELSIDNNATQYVDMTGQAPGLYVVKVRSENHEDVIKRFVLTAN